jgi:DNA-binding MarR family transcriptional regulator
MENKSIDLNEEKKHSSVGQYDASFAIVQVVRSHRALAVKLLNDIGLFPSQDIMLMQLWDKDGQSQQSLGQTLRIDHSTVAKSVRRLENKGLVSRSRSKEDGRVTVVSLTEAGRDLIPKIFNVWSNLEKLTTEDLTEEEKKLIVPLMQKIAYNVDEALKKQ